MKHNTLRKSGWYQWRGLVQRIVAATFLLEVSPATSRNLWKNVRKNEKQKTQSRDLMQSSKSRIVAVWQCVFKGRLCTCSDQKSLESSTSFWLQSPSAACCRSQAARCSETSCFSPSYMGPCRMRQLSTSASRCCLPREPCLHRMSQHNRACTAEMHVKSVPTYMRLLLLTDPRSATSGMPSWHVVETALQPRCWASIDRDYSRSTV